MSGTLSPSTMPSYEAHITVDAPDALAARALATSLGLRFVHIELAAGQWPSQPMLTFVEPRSLAHALERAREVTAICERSRICVRRIKIERELDADDRAGADDARYFEAHLKLALCDEAQRAQAAEIAIRCGAHRSRNARRVTGDREERFLTVRTDNAEALAARVAALVAAIAERGLELLSRREECVVYDSARSLDQGWEGDQRASFAAPGRRS